MFTETLHRIFQTNHDGFIGLGEIEKPLTKGRYLFGLLIIFASAYSQYLIKGFGPLLALLVVYGIPIWVASYLFGSAIIRRSFRHTYTALKFGLGLFGVFTLLGTAAAAGIFSIIFMFDPKALNLLHHPNPVLHVPPEFAWVMVWLSLILVGPAEEYIFRGFIYGGLLVLFKDRHWLSLAFFSSILFAAAHLYYALVYGIASWPSLPNWSPWAWRWPPHIISRGAIFLSR